jgi:hypothetical protein
VLSSASLKAQARTFGFDAIGVADARDAWPNAAWLQEFIDHNRHGDMSWMEQQRSSPASGGGAERSEAEGRVAPVEAPAPKPITAPTKPKKGEPAPDINPAGLYKREGEAALSAALQGQKLTALRALVTEHNLDPSGVTSTLTRDELAAHIVDQAKRRAERDEKMFDY